MGASCYLWSSYHLLLFLASLGAVQCVWKLADGLCSIPCWSFQCCNSLWLIRMWTLHPFPLLLGFSQSTGLSISSLLLGSQGSYEAALRPRHWYTLSRILLYCSGTMLETLQKPVSFIFWETYSQVCFGFPSSFPSCHCPPSPIPEMWKNPWAPCRDSQSKV